MIHNCHDQISHKIEPLHLESHEKKSAFHHSPLLYFRLYSIRRHCHRNGQYTISSMNASPLKHQQLNDTAFFSVGSLSEDEEDEIHFNCATEDPAMKIQKSPTPSAAVLNSKHETKNKDTPTINKENVLNLNSRNTMMASGGSSRIAYDQEDDTRQSIVFSDGIKKQLFSGRDSSQNLENVDKSKILRDVQNMKNDTNKENDNNSSAVKKQRFKGGWRTILGASACKKTKKKQQHQILETKDNCLNASTVHNFGEVGNGVDIISSAISEEQLATEDINPTSSVCFNTEEKCSSHAIPAKEQSVETKILPEYSCTPAHKLPDLLGTTPNSSSSSDDSSPPTIDFGSLGISNRYSLSGHVLKYSEIELEAKIASAIASAQQEHERTLEEQEQKHRKMEATIRNKHGKEMHGLMQKLGALRKEREEYNQERMSLRDARDSAKSVTRENDKRFEVERTTFNSTIQRLKNAHTLELDEMLQALDTVEGEYKTKLEESQRILIQKDAVITAVGSQVVEANKIRQKLESEIESLRNEASKARRDEETAKQATEDFNRRTEELEATHARNLSDEKTKRAKAVEKMKFEMKTAAEEQFAEANKIYLNLKREYEKSKEEIGQLKKDFQLSTNKLNTVEASGREKQAKRDGEIVRLKSEIKAASREKDAVTAKEAEALVQLEQVQNNCTAAHLSLATVVAAKEKLQKENEELNTICEELMATLEQNTENETSRSVISQNLRTR